MASLLRFAYVMAVRRAVTGWRLEAVLFGGILLAVALMASGVIFSELLANAALREALSRAEPKEVNLMVRSFSSQDDPPDLPGRRRAYQSRDEFVEQQIAAPFRPFLMEQSRYLETATFFFQGYPHLELERDIRPRGAVFHLSKLRDHARLAQGSWPEGAGVSGEPVDVAVDRLGAELLQLDVGQVMEIMPASSADDYSPIEVRISGVYEVSDRSEEFWYGLSSALSRKDERWTLIPLYAAEEAIIAQVLGAYQGLYTDTTWHFFTDRESILAEDVDELQRILARVERVVPVGLKNSSYSIRLDTLLRSFEEQLLLAGLPLLLMLFLVTGILIYYLALVAGLIVRSRSVEIAMLKSRGATVWQLGILGAGEGLLLAVPAVIAGPFLALGVVKLLGVVFFRISGASGGLADIPVGVSLNAFLIGMAGGILAVLVFTLATLAAARRGEVESRQSSSRPPTSTLLHRYYLDVALLALIGVVWWQLQSRGAFLVQSLGSRELAVDYSLLLGPALGLVAAGLIVLRVFPWAAAILGRLTEPVSPAWLMHVLRRLGRDPMAPAMLIVLVMLATALGVMGSAFSATLERGQQERALYRAGAELRIQHGGFNAPELRADAIPWPEEAGDISAAEVYRSSAYLTTTGFSTGGELLAVDTDAFAGVSWFRDDFGDGRPLSELLAELKTGAASGLDGAAAGPEQDGVPLPADATGLALWARPGGSAQYIGIWARLQDSEGRIVDALVGELQSPEWARLSLDLSTVGQTRGRFGGRTSAPDTEFAPPFDLLAISVQSRLRENEGGAMFLGSVDAITPAGETPVHDFGSLDGWRVVEDFRKPGLYSLESSRAAAGGEIDVAGRFSWASGGVGLIGVRAGGPDTALPALVSSEFLDIADAEVGDTVILGMSTHALLLDVVAEVDYFPTLDPTEGPFAVVDLAGFIRATTRHSPSPPRRSNELWLAGNGADIDPEAVTAALRREGVTVRHVHHAPSMVALQVEQPLVNAGWGALLVLLFLAVALASASGLMLFSHLDAQERQTEFALLRTLGTSRGQMQRVVWASLLFMAVCGVGLGTFLGWLLGASLLPLMEVAEGGSRVTPSLAFTTDWWRLVVSYVILAGVTSLCGLWLTWLTGKLRLHEVLRMGE